MINKNILISFSYIFLLLFFICGINYISLKHYLKKDVTKDKIYSLNEKSKAVSSDLKNDILIYVYFNENHELSILLKNLLNAYEAYSQKIKVHWINPYRDFEIIKNLGAMADNFKINSILIKSENRHKFLTPNDLANYDRNLEQFGLPPKLTEFIGEMVITGTLIDIGKDSPLLIGLINNHGERNPNLAGDDGISSFIKLMTSQGFKFSIINITNLKEIPEKVNILASIQPRMDYEDDELSLLLKWVKDGGKLFFALDPLVNKINQDMMGYNLNPLLKKFGLIVEDTIVIDPSKQIPYSRPDNLYADSYGENSIVKNLKGSPCLFFQARSIAYAASSDVEIYPLISSSDKGWGETNYKASQYNFAPDSDKPGPNFIGIASKIEHSNGKIVVFGDSDFMSNVQINNPGNLKLIENCFYWLSENTNLLDIPPKKSNEVTVSLNRKQLIFIFILSVVMLPFLVICFGALIWIKRYKS